MRLRGAWVTGILALAACVGCSEGSKGFQQQPPPPSDASAPWVGCYTCNTLVTGIPPTPGHSVRFTNGLEVTASSDALTGHVAELMGDGGTYVCWLHADVTGPGQATLDGPPWVQACPIESPGPWLATVDYQNGTFALDAGALTADFAVGFPLPGAAPDGGPNLDGTGNQITTCTRLAAGACPWD
jgi:hypothetical protein